ncbi:hypothetical protein D3C74_451580 [compost metagenome]
MFASGTSPPIGVSVSCIVLTAPVSVAVVTVANKADWARPKRTSLPSILPWSCAMPRALNAGLPALSAESNTPSMTMNIISIDTNNTRPCLAFPTIFP